MPLSTILIKIWQPVYIVIVIISIISLPSLSTIVSFFLRSCCLIIQLLSTNYSYSLIVL